MVDGKPGRKSYGEVAPLTTRWPVGDREVIRAESKRLGISESSYTILVFNTALDRPIPDWLQAELDGQDNATDSIRRGQPMARSA